MTIVKPGMERLYLCRSGNRCEEFGRLRRSILESAVDLKYCPFGLSRPRRDIFGVSRNASYPSSSCVESSLMALKREKIYDIDNATIGTKLARFIVLALLDSEYGGVTLCSASLFSLHCPRTIAQDDIISVLVCDFRHLLQATLKIVISACEKAALLARHRLPPADSLRVKLVST
jgi:hypothetical protein